MEVKGKCKEDFEEWYLKRYFPNVEAIGISKAISLIDKGAIGLMRFYSLPEEMQWGVFTDFFDSKGVVISVEFCGNFDSYPDGIPGFDLDIYRLDINEWIGTLKFNSREETRTAAINKACEIYNSKKR